MAMLCHGSTSAGGPCKSTGHPCLKPGYMMFRIKLLNLKIVYLSAHIYHPFILFGFIWEAAWNVWTVALCVFSHIEWFLLFSLFACCLIRCVGFWSQSKVLVLDLKLVLDPCGVDDASLCWSNVLEFACQMKALSNNCKYFEVFLSNHIYLNKRGECYLLSVTKNQVLEHCNQKK